MSRSGRRINATLGLNTEHLKARLNPLTSLWRAPRRCSNTAAADQFAVEKVPPVAVLDFDNPKIAVEARLAFEHLFNASIGHELPFGVGDECAPQIRVIDAGRRRTKQRRVAVLARDLDEYGAGIIIAMTPDSREGARNMATP